MPLSNAFYESVKNGNVRRVRIMMKDSLLVDPSFARFSEMERAARNLNGLYDQHDGKTFINDPSQWNDDYMNKLMVEVVINFSHERIDHLKDVVHYLRPVTKKDSANSSTNGVNRKHDYSGDTSYQAQKRHAQENGDYLGVKIGVGAVAGGVAGGVVASVAGITVIGGAVAGAVIGGVIGGIAASAVSNNGGKKI